MTRTARKASLLVVFLLLASAATAYAECAWMLWRVSVDDWHIMRAYSQEDGSKRACDRDAADFTNRSVRGPGQILGLHVLSRLGGPARAEGEVMRFAREVHPALRPRRLPSGASPLRRPRFSGRGRPHLDGLHGWGGHQSGAGACRPPIVQFC